VSGPDVAPKAEREGAAQSVPRRLPPALLRLRFLAPLRDANSRFRARAARRDAESSDMLLC